MPLIFQDYKSHFQALFKENFPFSRQIEKSSTFQDSIQIQALFKVCGNHVYSTWWRHAMETLSIMLAIWEITSGFPSQKASNTELWCFLSHQPMNKLLHKQSSCQWFETPWRSHDVTVTTSHEIRTLHRLIDAIENCTLKITDLPTFHFRNA